MNKTGKEICRECLEHKVVLNTRTRQEYSECVIFLRKLFDDMFDKDIFSEFGENTCINISDSYTTPHYSPKYFYEESERFYRYKIVSWASFKKYYDITEKDVEAVKVMSYEEAVKLAAAILSTKKSLEEFLKEQTGQNTIIV